MERRKGRESGWGDGERSRKGGEQRGRKKVKRKGGGTAEWNRFPPFKARGVRGLGPGPRAQGPGPMAQGAGPGARGRGPGSGPVAQGPLRKAKGPGP